MDYSFKCDPENEFYTNLKLAMAPVVRRHNDIDEFDILTVLNAIVDDLTRIMKGRQLRKHRLKGPIKALYNNIFIFCAWCNQDIAKEGIVTDSPGLLTIRQLYNRVRCTRDGLWAAAYTIPPDARVSLDNQLRV